MTTKHRSHVIVDMEATSELRLCVRSIRVVDGDVTRDELSFEWFNMVGNTREEARMNCLDSLAFYLKCRPGLRDTIMNALDPSCADEVKKLAGGIEA